MRALENLKPENVFYYFEEIANIPHGSRNTKQISDYLVNFAKERNLEHYQDKIGNVIIIKEASEGYEDHEPVMLQGHMDMVAVKKPDCDIDMAKEGLRLRLLVGKGLGGADAGQTAFDLLIDVARLFLGCCGCSRHPLAHSHGYR